MTIYSRLHCGAHNKSTVHARAGSAEPLPSRLNGSSLTVERQAKRSQASLIDCFSLQSEHKF